jgi:hypothetical protein
MSAHKATFRVHQLLAASHPEPLDTVDLVRRLSLPRRVVEFALLHGVRSGQIRRGRPMCAPQGYGYTVVTE